MKIYRICGFWKDNPEETFEDCAVLPTHDFIEDLDEEIFYYGLSEIDIKDAIENGNIAHDFEITSYYEDYL